MRVEEDRHEHDGVTEQNRDQRLRPVHAGGHQAGRQHVGRDAVRHADPQRGVVICGPVAFENWNRREITVPQRAVGDVFFEFDKIGFEQGMTLSGHSFPPVGWGLAHSSSIIAAIHQVLSVCFVPGKVRPALRAVE